MNELMIFEGHEVEAFELNGEVLFNPYHVGACLDMAMSTVKDHMSKMNKKQVIKVKNSDVGLTDFRKLNCFRCFGVRQGKCFRSFRRKESFG